MMTFILGCLVGYVVSVLADVADERLMRKRRRRPRWVCQDCCLETDLLVAKSDHHGGTKHVCVDRRVCNQRSPG